MKKIDLHIHTLASPTDAEFEFSLAAFERYVEDCQLDAVAITNHNLFDESQYLSICERLDAVVFPGIEINLGSGHLLLIADDSMLDDFVIKSKETQDRVALDGRLSFEQLQEIYGDLNRYLLIPHSGKKPAIRGSDLARLSPYISAGEVDSPKKFVRAVRDDSALCPLLFSDARITDELTRLPTRQTYLDCGEISLQSLKTSIRDKSKVALSRNDGIALWQVLENGLEISTGLNVLMGARSSGKTYTLDCINEASGNAKYVRQFDLVQQNADDDKRTFDRLIEQRKSVFADDYLAGFKVVVEDMMSVDRSGNAIELEQYHETLLKSAEESERQDSFSKAALFEEDKYPIPSLNTLDKLIQSVRQVIENVEYKEIIEKHVDLDSMKLLARELIGLFWAKTLESNKKKVVNELVDEVKKALQVRTSATAVSDFDAYKYMIDEKRIERFEEIVDALKVRKVIHSHELQGFAVEAEKSQFKGAQEVKTTAGSPSAFSGAFSCYGKPYSYLRHLLDIENLDHASIYKLFVKISYQILNHDGFEVSGGERSEFRLLQAISDAQQFEILLLDEPESSFDNVFLRDGVNQLIKRIAQTMPVVVVTHNSTVGASIGANRYLYTKKENIDGSIRYKTYAGYPGDAELKSPDGSTIPCSEVLYEALEAGRDTYNERRKGYEALEN